ncbi:MAG: mechanosensitive ion channel [Polyangiaceae bacterium]
MLNPLEKSVESMLYGELFLVGKTRVTIMTVVTVGVIIAASYTLSWVLRFALRRALKQRGVGVEKGGISAAGRMFHYVVVLAGILVAFNTVGIQLQALFAAGAVFAVGVGFAMQNIAQNFVSGVILMIERSIEPGDIIEVNSHVVRVEQMGIRATVVRTLDDEDMIVPNSTLVQSTVKNFTHLDNIYRIRVNVGVAYSSDLKLVRRALEGAASGVGFREPAHEPRVLLLDFGPSSVVWEVSVWIKDPWNYRVRQSELREAVWEALASYAVTIAFPQIDVHFDAPVARGLAALGRAA